MAFLCAAIAADFCTHKHLQRMVRNFGSWHSIRVHIDVGQQIPDGQLYNISLE